MKQDQQKKLSLTTLVLAAVMMAQSSAALLEDLTVWYWNFFIYFSAVGDLAFCWYFGGWGLFWDGDEGLLTQTCLDTFNKGSQVTFPVAYNL